jgi:hypothetical protein
MSLEMTTVPRIVCRYRKPFFGTVWRSSTQQREPIFAEPMKKEIAQKIVQWLRKNIESRNRKNGLVLGGVLSLVIPTLHIKLAKGLKFIECKSAFHNSIYRNIKII